MSDFGDKDPEDAYDRGDHPDLRYTVLLRAVRHIVDRPDHRSDHRRRDLLRVIAAAGLDDHQRDLLRAALGAG